MTTNTIQPAISHASQNKSSPTSSASLPSSKSEKSMALPSQTLPHKKHSKTPSINSRAPNSPLATKKIPFAMGKLVAILRHVPL
ncbi:MAG: hypothetical protein Q4B28_00180 [bacterium]|nr:hypothetical protein [bacterium]